MLTCLFRSLMLYQWQQRIRDASHQAQVVEHDATDETKVQEENAANADNTWYNGYHSASGQICI